MNSHSRLEGPSRACEALARHFLSGFSHVIHTSCDYILNDLQAFYAQLCASKAVAVSFCGWLKYTVKMRHAIQSLFEPPRHSTNRQPCQWTTITEYIRRLPPARFFCSIPKYPLHAKQIMQNTKTYAHLPIDHDQHINLRIFIQNVMRFIRSLRYGVVWRDYLQHLLIVYDGRTCNNRLLHIFLQQHSKKRCGPSGHPRNWSFHRPSLALAQLCNFDQRSRARTVEVHVSSCLLYTLPAAAMSTRHIYTSLTFTHITTRWAMKSFIAVHYDNDIMKIQTNNMNRQMFGLVDSNNKP